MSHVARLITALGLLIDTLIASKAGGNLVSGWFSPHEDVPSSIDGKRVTCKTRESSSLIGNYLRMDTVSSRAHWHDLACTRMRTNMKQHHLNLSTPRHTSKASEDP